MKYIILICDGAADWPINELGNKTIIKWYAKIKAQREKKG